MPVPQISALPTPPSTASPANFDERADAFVEALPGFVDEANLLATEVNTQAAQVSSDAASVADSRTDVDAARADVDAKAIQVAADKVAAAASAAAAAASASQAGNFDPANYLRKDDNLASVQNKPQARVNIGLRIGTAAIWVNVGDPGGAAQDGDIWIP